jgi:hypothetical protein
MRLLGADRAPFKEVLKGLDVLTAMNIKDYGLLECGTM